VTREEWGARSPSSEIEPLSVPVDTVIVASTVTLGCVSPDVCIPRLKEIQNDQMNKQKAHDIVYNMLLPTESIVYEGRGWDKVNECDAGGELHKII
jgi:hypothetical protein